MERRKKNWGTISYALKAGTRQHPLHRSSPNLPTSSRSYFSEDIFDDDDDYGFVPKPAPPVPAPPRPRTPLEFNEDYQRKVKEYQNKLYWESIKHKLTQYYSHRHHESSANNHRARSSVNNTSMATSTKLSQPKQPPKTSSTTAHSVPVQSSSVLDGELLGRTRRDSGSTIDLLEAVNDLQDSCARLEDFEDEVEECSSSEKHSRLCVKCLVKYYNTRQDSIGVGGCERSVASAMSRVSYRKWW